MFIVYWRNGKRETEHGFVRARTHDEAYDFAYKKLPKGSVTTAIYRVSNSAIDSDGVCLNFRRWEETR